VPVIWNVSPVLLELGPLKLRYYGLMFLVAFILGLRGMRWVCKKEGIDPERMETLLSYVFVGTLVGARLGHCLFYDPAYYFSHPLEIFAIWHGGLASHGGVTGVILAVALYVYKNRDLSFLWVADRVAIFTAFAGGFIRIGNLMNSEIIGKPTGSNFGFIFTHIDQVPRHPTQIYESATYFLLGLGLLWLYRKYQHKPPAGLLIGIALTVVFAARFVLEFFKENQETFENALPINMGQILSIPFAALGIYLIISALRKKTEIEKKTKTKKK
jgi:phosphatidylglycerol:prolipoprotein diacylglycerol transferase